MTDMRAGFREIVEGWTLIDDFDELTDRIERSAAWAKANAPLLPDEQATAELMIRAQIARGMPHLIRSLGLEKEFGLPPLERCPTCGALVETIFDHIDTDCEHD
jgi:hypothetical protein